MGHDNEPDDIEAEEPKPLVDIGDTFWMVMIHPDATGQRRFNAVHASHIHDPKQIPEGTQVLKSTEDAPIAFYPTEVDAREVARKMSVYNRCAIVVLQVAAVARPSVDWTPPPPKPQHPQED